MKHGKKPVAVVITVLEFDPVRNDYVVYISHGIDLDSDTPFAMNHDPVHLHPDVVFDSDYNEYMLMENQTDEKR